MTLFVLPNSDLQGKWTAPLYSTDITCSTASSNPCLRLWRGFWPNSIRVTEVSTQSQGWVSGCFLKCALSVWGANLPPSWSSGQAEWSHSLFIWGDRVTQDSLYSWAKHAQLSCQLAEVTAAEANVAPPRPPTTHTHEHREYLDFSGYLLNVKYL